MSTPRTFVTVTVVLPGGVHKRWAVEWPSCLSHRTDYVCGQLRKAINGLYAELVHDGYPKCLIARAAWTAQTTEMNW